MAHRWEGRAGLRAHVALVLSLTVVATASCGNVVTPAPGQDETSDGGGGGSPPWLGSQGLRLYDTEADLHDMAVGADGSVYLVIGYEPGDTFAGRALESGVSPNAPAALVKIDRAGDVEWIRSWVGSSHTFAVGVTMTSDGDVVSCGLTFGSVDLGGGTLVPASGEAGFVARHTPGGEHVWSSLIETSSADEAQDCVSDGAGGVFVSLGGGMLMVPSGSDAVVAQYDPSGAIAAVHAAGGGFVQGLSVAVGPSGEPVVGGTFSSEVDWGQGPITAEASDAFLVSYSASGQPEWMLHDGGPEHQYVGSVASTPNGTVSGGEYWDVDLAETRSFVRHVSQAGEELWAWTSDVEPIGVIAVHDSGAEGAWVSGLSDHWPAEGHLFELDAEGKVVRSIPTSGSLGVWAFARRDDSALLAAGRYEEAQLDGHELPGVGVFLYVIESPQSM